MKTVEYKIIQCKAPNSNMESKLQTRGVLGGGAVHDLLNLTLHLPLSCVRNGKSVIVK